jgi:hypothetical protein
MSASTNQNSNKSSSSTSQTPQNQKSTTTPPRPTHTPQTSPAQAAPNKDELTPGKVNTVLRAWKQNQDVNNPDPNLNAK